MQKFDFIFFYIIDLKSNFFVQQNAEIKNYEIELMN